ncbi:phosphotransferase [uncultured Aquimonas sp.]|uniref:aminoglycoside phosphotransferase family protein n=1 Tax=uncultured Aquimonas sp. TaxID=385483 RepID=UPI00086F78B8|nr:phosphotransferase [uncultured Aquimonas sp.]ODU43588.1 MAG: aminoglycoside phosphotransferase [Xanthomonadaceae bacterium SCN 69-123]
MPPDDARALEALAWARAHLGRSDLSLAPAASDASFRRYLRLDGAPELLLMDSPPAQVPLQPWLAVGALIGGAGLRVPKVIAADVGLGLALIEHLGDALYQHRLDEHSADALYGRALEALLRLQSLPADAVPPYEHARFEMELELMPEWFLRRHLGIALECEDWDPIESAFRLLLDSAMAQPRVFVHRDYHSRNLIDCTPGPGILDFQDALGGPLTYDLVSLLRDCYLRWDEARVQGWAEDFRRELVRAGHIADAPQRFFRAFDLMGLQRHLKVLGIFCRLHYRDGKAGYLADLPRVLGYVLDIAARHPELADFRALMQRFTEGRELTRPREDASA